MDAVTRSLSVIAGLIKKELRAAEEAADAARQPYFEVVGDLLAEARPQFDTAAEFLSWTWREFRFKQTQSYNYLSLGKKRETYITRAKEPPSYESLRHYQRATGRSTEPTSGRSYRAPEWKEPVDNLAERARREQERLQEEEMTRRQEREAERALALKLIDIGFKVLAKELHPDKGGSREAMARLSRVRDRLRNCA